MVLRIMGFKLVLLLFVYFILAFPQNVYAYLDMGTGSYFFQLLMAGLLGFSFFFKSFLRSSRTFVANIFSKSHEDEGGE